nr:G protein-coupled receptor {clone PTE33} [rats, Fischer, lingual epithelia, Peptide, 234 aa] [Rattus sp.]
MYLFFSNLSFVDIYFISGTIPKILVNMQSKTKDISYIECLTQVYFFNTFVGMDDVLRTLMAYDRFVAICMPLKYTVIMNPRVCTLLVLMFWIIMFCISLIHVLLMNELNFSRGTKIPHFFCELAQVLKVSNSDTHINNIFMYVLSSLLGVIPMTGILMSYSQIVSSILRMSSTVSKYKAFSTCGSHLCVVCLFYGSVIGVYFSSSVVLSTQRIMVASLMYTVISPMFNPFIYSL